MKSAEKILKISCDCKDTLKLDELTEFQGGLKSRTDEEIDKIVKSIKKHGFSFPFFVWKRDGVNNVLDGHGRLLALHKLDELGFLVPPLPVVYVDCKDEQAARDLLLRLNSHYGTMTKESVLEFIGDFEIDVSDLELPCGTIEFESGEEPDAETQGDDDIPEVKDKPVSQPGEMYELGNSILMCGDSTSEEDVARLMGGEKITLTFTDPPYELETQGGGVLKSSNSMKQIENNRVNHFDPLRLKIYSETNIYFHNKPLIKKYIDLAEQNKKPYDLAFYKKTNTAPNYKGHLMTDCEYIAIIGKQNPNKGLDKELYSKCFIGKKDVDNKLSYSKPVELCEKYLKLFSQGNVLDLFGGSGTTLIASEKLKIKCFMMELDPHYCDVIRKRYTQWAKENNRPQTSGCLE